MTNLDAYSPPPLRAGIGLFLDKNEGPRSGALRALDGLDLAEAARRYPDSSRMTALLAERVGVTPDRVLVTAGGDDAIDRLCRLTLSPSRGLVTHDPTFEMIPLGAARCGAPVRSAAWMRGGFPRDQFIDLIDPTVGLVALVTPNNPTGLAIDAEDVLAVARAADRAGATLLLDLAYAEFADSRAVEELAPSLPNTVIVRTLSKAWGLAGLRVGYAIAEPPMLARLRAVGAPFAASSVSLALAERALGDGEGVRAVVERVRDERRLLADAARRLGADADDSQANFVLTRWPDAFWVRDALASQGIGVRAFPGRPGLGDALRITCPADGADCERLVGALRTAVEPRALLLDLDGVIADVSRSYRRAIIETARSFAVEVSAQDVRDAKAQGDANNDWLLTQRLLARRGVAAPLGLVTERFEALYQGSNGTPGLRALESLLVDRETLEALGASLPMAIVTGRPRADAQRFLHEQGIGGLFPVVVCMEDAPVKPDPAPVRLALQRLGVTSAWMVGDTPDDIVAARQAGVVPIGIPAPSDDPEDARRVLTQAGAARVIRSLTELLEIVP
ncbi:MAG TPA: TIGR01548 family HAD-type hydrolase [Phycisphaerales bacterium]|nr:TIGR01548 family HAD-type hydrolase [Phycisphaerales bacterium]